MKKDLKKLISICLCIGSFTCINNVNAETLSTNGGAGYSNWQDSCPTSGSCKEKTFYRYRDVSAWSDTYLTSKPNDFYKQGTIVIPEKKEEKQMSVEASKNSDVNGVVAQVSDFGEPVTPIRFEGTSMNHSAGASGKIFGSNNSWYGCGDLNSCRGWTQIGYYSTSGYGADFTSNLNGNNKYRYLAIVMPGDNSKWQLWRKNFIATKEVVVQASSTKTVYYSPTSWGNWSNWQESWVGKTTSRDVQTKTFYSYPLELNITNQTKENEYSATGSSIKIDAPTNGSGSYTYSLVSPVTGFSVTSDGKIIHGADALGGKYTLKIKVVDNNTKAEKTVNYTVKIKPVRTITNYQLSVGDTEFYIYLSGLKYGATASSNGANSMALNNNDGLLSFKTTLKTPFSKAGNFNFNVTIDGVTWNYDVGLGKTPKFLSVSSAYSTFNNNEQTPNFYTNITSYEGQDKYFNWTICDSNGSCNGNTRKNVGKYKVNLSVKPEYACTNTETECTQERPIAIYDLNGNVATSTVVDFNIIPYKLTKSNTTVTATQTYIYDGLVFNPKVKVVVPISGEPLKQGVDYTVKTTKEISGSGTYSLVISGMGNYEGTVSDVGTIEIKKQGLPSTVTKVEDKNYYESKDEKFRVYYESKHYYTGEYITPSIILEIKQGTGEYSTLINEKDYSLTYENNKDIGNASIIVAGKGSYDGKLTLPFEILANQFSVSQYDGYAIYTGQATTGGAKVEVNNSNDAKIEYQYPDGNWKTDVPSFTDAKEYTFKYKVSKAGWTTVEGTLKTVIVKEKGNVDLNAASIELLLPKSKEMGFKNPTGSLSFEVANNDIVKVKQENSKVVFTPLKEGNTVVTVNVAESTNYKNTSVNVYVTVRLGELAIEAPDGNKVTYDGNSHNVFNNFVVYEKNDTSKTPLNGVNISYNYDGKTLNNPSFTDAGSYLVSYSVSKDGYESVYGTGQLTITPKSINNGDISITLDKYEYIYEAGKEYKPTPTVKFNGKVLQENKDYIVEYKNNKNAGTAKVNIVGIGNFKDEKSVNFEIKTNTIVLDGNWRNGDFDGNVEYTGYKTYGKDSKDCFYYPNNVEVGNVANKRPCTKAMVKVKSPVSYEIGYSDTKPVCNDGSANCTADKKKYGTVMPTFEDVGSHKVWFRVSAEGYEPIEGELNINIYKRYFKTPEPFDNPYIFTGLSQSPSWLNYNSKFMDMDGDVKGTEPKTYTTIFTLNDTKNTGWEDKQTGKKEVQWTIQNISVKDHELVVENEIAYNEVKQLYVSDGKVKFERTGYNQVGWVENCVDPDEDNNTERGRTCDYDKYSLIKTNAKDKKTCEANGNIWNAHTKMCQEKKLNRYDVASSFSGTYIANYLGYDTEKEYNLYALWSKAMYRIEYDLCDDKGCGVDPSNPTMASYDSSFIVKNPTRTGYLFAGWEITGMDETPHTIGDEIVSTKSFTVPEEWVGMTEETKKGGTVSMKNLTSIEDATVKLKAIWKPIKYTIHFDLNKNTYLDDLNKVTTADTRGQVNDMTVDYDTTAILNKNNFEMNGYDFVGWSTTKDGTLNKCTDYSEKLKKEEYLKESHYSNGKVERFKCLNFTNEQSFKNLTTKNNDEITLYAQWKRRNNTRFTVTYWKQNVGSSKEQLNSANYTKVGVETYTGTSDSLITLTPYVYPNKDNSANQSVACNGNNCYSLKSFFERGKTFAASVNKTNNRRWDNLNNKFIFDNSTIFNDKNQMNVTAKYTNEAKPTRISGNVDKDMFRGFTLQNSHVSNEYGEDRKNPQTQSFGNNREFTYILSPNGTTDIDIYYTRDSYTITYQMNGGVTGNNRDRLYQVSVTFNNAISNGSLKDGIKDAGEKDNSRDADFAGWFADPNVTVQVYGINGEVTTDSTVFAKWLQYRYTGKNGTNAWMSWGKINE